MAFGDVIVTTPKKQSENAAKEAADMIAHGGGYYFRRFGYVDNGRMKGYPRDLRVGNRVWYTEGGYVRGYAIVDTIIDTAEGMRCSTTGTWFPPGYYVLMRADSWVWVKPVKFKGFQGWRYLLQGISPKPIGTWLDPKPAIEDYQ